MRDESPTRPGSLLSVPPVEVAAAMLPCESRATAPTVSWESSGGEAVSGRFVVAESPAKVRSGRPGLFVSLRLCEAFAFAVEDELGVVDQGHAVGGGELFGSLGDEVDVRALVEDEAGGLDGVAQALDAGDSAGAEGGAVHEEGVELDAAFAGEEAAASGVEGGVVFEFGDSGFDSVDG